MEKGVKVVVEMEVKEIKLEHCCMGASTLGVVNSTKVLEEYLAEMVGWLARNGIEGQKTREEV